MKKMTIPRLGRAKHKLSMLTAYDCWTAKLADDGGADMILVGDSLAMVVQGKENTLSVTVDEMVYHVKMVKRGSGRALVVGDMPYMSYHISREDTVRNAGRLIAEGGADAVKLEGGIKRLPMIEAILDAEIPVMGHLGLTPQSVNALGGYRVQGKSDRARAKLKEDALALQEAGVFAVVLECVPFDLAGEITDLLKIPTIGIGAGPLCSGQVLVIHDMLGLNMGHTPKFVRRFGELGEQGTSAVEAYVQAVRDGSFPNVETEAYGASKVDNVAQLYGPNNYSLAAGK